VDHAVSLGETRAAAILLPRCARLPGMRLLLTHGTATGRAEGGCCSRATCRSGSPGTRAAPCGAFCAVPPAIGVLMETEIWPNLVAGCRRGGCRWCWPMRA
jgi:3-deoxy-D-manno-octulosonic-acid transferase